MEKSLKPAIKFWITWLLIPFLLGNVLLLNTGCDKKKGDTIATTPDDDDDDDDFITGKCQGCPSKMSLLATAVGTDFALNGGVRLQLALRIFGQSLQQYYAGPVAVDGYMYVGMDNGPYCPLPAGRYKVRTIRPGQTNGAQLYYGLEIEALHEKTKAKARVMLGDATGVHTINRVPAIPDMDGRLYNFALQKSVYVLDINGRPCDAYMGWFELE